MGCQEIFPCTHNLGSEIGIPVKKSVTAVNSAFHMLPGLAEWTH